MKFTKDDILKDTEFKRFLRSKSLKDSSINLYVIRLRIYCDFHQMSISELIDEAEKEQDIEKVKKRKRKVNERLGDFADHLVKEGKSVYTVRGYIESIKAIYNYCDIDTEKIGVPSPNKNKAYEDLISIDEIKLAVQSATIRDRAMILTHMSSGMGLSEVRGLTYGDFLKAVGDYTNRKGYISPEDLISMLDGIEDIIPRWKMIRVKTEYPFITFTSPEATRDTLRYLEYRQPRAFPITNEDDILFCSSNYGKKGANGVGRKISKKAYVAIFQRYNDKLGFGRKGNGFRRFTSHELRRFFGTQCIRAGLDKMSTDWMMGHAIDEQDAAYFKIREDDLRKRYLKALPYLTLDDVKRVQIDDPEVKELRKQLKESQEKNESYDSLKKEVEGLKKKFIDSYFEKPMVKSEVEKDLD